MKIDHSISKGYPFDGIMSRVRFINRPKISIDENKKIIIECDKNVFPDFKKPNLIQRLFAGSVIDFLMFRLFDYAEALVVSENQVMHLLEDMPFIPEEFGFEAIIKPKDTTDNPTKVYGSKYDDRYSLFRHPEKIATWVLVTRKSDGSFLDMNLFIPNHRIAYAVFLSLEIPVESKELEPTPIGEGLSHKVLEM